MWAGPDETRTRIVHRLFTAPVDEVTEDLLRAFLAQQIREGHIAEYKKVVTNEVVEVIASYANTFGGLGSVS